MKRLFCLTLILLFKLSSIAADVEVVLHGLKEGDTATISIVSNEYLDNIVAGVDGKYTFRDIPSGNHAVKVEARGYSHEKSIPVSVGADGSVLLSSPLEFRLERQESDEWYYSWQSDDSPAGYTTTSYVNNPPQIEFLGETTVPSDVPYSAVLLNEYRIILEDGEEPWTQEYAYRLVETLKTLCVDRYGQTYSKFTLTSSRLADDIEIDRRDSGSIVRISKEAFSYANPFLVNLDGEKGRFFSKRLHHALVNYVTDYGRDTRAVERILSERFGCRISGIDY